MILAAANKEQELFGYAAWYPSQRHTGHGSSPLFADTKSQEKFGARTGYHLHRYKENHDKLPTAQSSDPRPKRDGVDDDHPEATGGYGGTGRGLFSPRLTCTN